MNERMTVGRVSVRRRGLRGLVAGRGCIFDSVWGKERGVCLLKGIAEGTYKTKHAEAAKLYYTTIYPHTQTHTQRVLFIERYRRGHLQFQARGSR